MTALYFGPAGWSYKDWEGIVYPQPKPSSFHPLNYLPQFFDIIEINSTFYRPPSVKVSLSWVKRIASFPRFQLSVKLHQVFSHERGNFTQADIDQFKLGLEPLRAHERLAALLIQFPWSFTYTRINFDYLVSLIKHFSDYPLAVEVRHVSWHKRSFFQMLHDYGVAFCNIDQPLLPNSLPPTAYATTQEMAYVRLHGRNTRDWFRQEASRDERYNYLYSPSELAEWVEKIKILKEKAGKVIVITNNHYRGQAVVNALQIKHILTGEKFPLPPSLVNHYPQLTELTLTNPSREDSEKILQKKLFTLDKDN
jgi:uncharacterized protein YecE (DUF72 family)